MNTRKKITFSLILTAIALVLLFSPLLVFAANPVAPDNINVTANETKGTNPVKIVNISGGYIASLNFTATIQNPRWKGFIGWVSGEFTLDDASGSTLYDWSVSSITGNVYATRNSSTPAWTSIACSSTTNLENENTIISHTGQDDNITATFDDTTHSAFWVGTTFISANSCPTLNTYVDNSTQDTAFEEMALFDSHNIIFTTLLEEDEAGFDSNPYDFQMIVPENGAQSFQGSTAYYLYVELTS